MADGDPYESLSVTNAGDVVQEVSLSTQFGYPAPGPDGRLVLRYDAGGQLAAHDLAPHMEMYPKRFILTPGARQTVRVFTPASSSLDDGIYFTRLLVEAKPQQVPESAGGASFARVTFGVRQSTAVIMRKGPRPKQTPRLGNIESKKGGLLRVRVGSDGGAPYWGVLHLRLTDAEGKEVFASKRAVAAYVPTAFRFDAASLPAGRYEATVRLSPRRLDIPKEHRSVGPVVERTGTVTIR